MILVKNISGKTIHKGEYIISDQVKFIKDCGNCHIIDRSKSYSKLPDCCIQCIKHETTQD